MPIRNPITATLGAVGSLFGLGYDQQIRALDDLAAALGRDAAPAAAKLGEALGEIDRMLTALDAELVRYLELRFDDGPVPRADLRTLLELEAGQARVRIETARGHCSRIETIYEVHLKRWFHDLLDSDGAAALARIFEAMHDADMSVIWAAEQIDAFLMQHAEGTLDLLRDGDVLGANLLVNDARDQALPFRRDLFAELATLRRYEGIFHRAAQVA